MKIRKAKQSEAKRLSELMTKDINLITSKKYSKKQISAMKRYVSKENIKGYIKKWDVFIAIEDKKILGTITLDRNILVSPYVADSNNFVKDPIMENLLKFAEERVKKLGEHNIRLISLNTTKDYFQKKGYKIIERLILGKYVKFIEFMMEKRIK